MPDMVLIDNFDSFSYNLVQLFAETGTRVHVVRQQATCREIRAMDPDFLVIGPGPGDPKEAGVSLAAIRHFAGKIPLLGVCLGMQCIAEVFGGQTIFAPAPVHGKTDRIHHTGEGLFSGIPSPFMACRYHSLAVRLPEKSPLEIHAKTPDNTPMAVTHKNLPVYGVQFHPESFLTEHGPLLARNFIGAP